MRGRKNQNFSEQYVFRHVLNYYTPCKCCVGVYDFYFYSFRTFFFFTKIEEKNKENNFILSTSK